mmetsp:Transcript_85579/g.238932  ORF Transcript_85579/g.238932 Transcript_85579/m.238932 type:complete len:494 (-) Transcript_85579:382-1863(-)
MSQAPAQKRPPRASVLHGGQVDLQSLMLRAKNLVNEAFGLGQVHLRGVERLPIWPAGTASTFVKLLQNPLLHQAKGFGIRVRHVAFSPVADHRVAAPELLGETILQPVLHLLQRLKLDITCLVAHLDKVFKRHIANRVRVWLPLFLQIGEARREIFGRALFWFALAIHAAMLVQQPAQPECVLEAAIAALAEERHHRVARVPDEDDLPLHCPCRRPHRSQDPRWVLGDLVYKGLHAPDEGHCFLVILLAEFCALRAALRRVGHRLEGLGRAMVVHVYRASERAIPIGQCHQHVVASRPNVKSVCAMARFAAMLACRAEVILPRVRKEHFLVASGQDVLREGGEASTLERVAHPRARAIASDDRAAHRYADATLQLGLAGRSLREVQHASDELLGGTDTWLAPLTDGRVSLRCWLGATDEIGCFGHRVVEMELCAFPRGHVDQELVQLDPRYGIIALRIVLAVALKDDLAIRHMDNAAADLRGEPQHVFIEAAA